jgi:hypothetical protein
MRPEGPQLQQIIQAFETPLIMAPDLGYGQTDLLMNSAEEVSRLLNAYARVILASGS